MFRRQLHLKKAGKIRIPPRSKTPNMKQLSEYHNQLHQLNNLKLKRLVHVNKATTLSNRFRTLIIK